MATNFNTPYRILSLDGGGSWALIQAIALADIYGLNTNGRDILRKFNLAVANSGGSIVLAGLILDMTPRQIFNIFDSELTRKRIFDKNFFDDYIVDTGFRRYSTKSKFSGLRNAFPATIRNLVNTPLASINQQFGITTEVVISAFNYDRERTKFFRSNLASNAASISEPGLPDATLLQAIHASSTAPVKYFDDPAIIPAGDFDMRFWDGGVGGFNNPVMAGVVEALANYPQQRENIRILSIGTGNNFLPLWTPGTINNGLFKKPEDPCLITDISLVARAIVSDPPDAASYTAHVVLGGSLPVGGQPLQGGHLPLVRVNPLVQPIKVQGQQGQFGFPKSNNQQRPIPFTHSDFIRLTQLELDAIEPEDVNLIKRFTALWLDGDIANQPIRTGGPTLDCEIGHDRYRAALAQWRMYDRTVLDPGTPEANANRLAIQNILWP
jgi:hypothetical protein